jgi:hypothetical protein
VRPPTILGYCLKHSGPLGPPPGQCERKASPYFETLDANLTVIKHPVLARAAVDAFRKSKWEAPHETKEVRHF